VDEEFQELDVAATTLPLRRRVWLTRTDQLGVACFATLALAAIGIHYGSLDGEQRNLVDLRDPVVLKRDQLGFQLDINRATWPEWRLLPRIGETMARRIVDSRDTGGAFESHDDLRRVSGIGPKTLAQMRPYLLAVETDNTDRRPK